MIDKLRCIGLNKNEAKAYLFLVKNGVSTAYQVAKGSLVPNGKIYQILDSLNDKGFVKKFEGFPQRFISLDPQVAFNSIYEKKQGELDSFKENIGIILSDLGELSNRKSTDPMDSLRIIEGYKNCDLNLRYLKKIISTYNINYNIKW